MNKRQIEIWAITLLITGMLLSSFMVISAKETNEFIIGENLEISKISSKFSLIPHSLEITETIQASHNQLDTLHSVGVDYPVFDFGGIDVINPAILTDGGANVLIGAEVYESAINADIHFRFSTDAGSTWLPEDGTVYWDLAGAGFLPEKPAIDFSGDLGAIGTFLEVNQQGLPQLDFDDIADYEAGNGWTLLVWNIEDPLDSVDVGGWTSAYSPNPQYSKGILSMTGDIQGTTNVLYLLWSDSETSGTGIWTGGADASYEWESLKVDNDLSTGMHWEAYEISSNGGEFQDGVEIDWCPLDGTSDWWQNNQWSGSLIEGARHPDIDAGDGKAYCAFEFDGAIVCAYSNNNGGTMQTVEVASSGTNPHVAIAGDNVIITYIQNGNLVASVSENSGQTWEEVTVNDDAGTVADETHSSSISGGYMAWTHEESYSSIYFDSLGLDVPVIEITSVSGGVGVTVNVENTGTADGEDIPYSIVASGGILGMINKEASGTISVGAGSSTSISLPMLIGLGAVTIEIQVGTASETIQGTQLLIFTQL